MNTVIERLEQKINELNESLALNSGGSWGSQRKEFLSKQIKNCEGLIKAYENISTPLTLQEAQEKLNQQVGFEEQKSFVLGEINVRAFLESRSIEQNFPIFCFVGPPGAGKTTFARILAEALGKPFFLLALSGESKPSTLTGSTTESSRAEIGRIAKCLIQGEKSDPFILLDEIDKTSLHDTLNPFLDPAQNQNIHEYCLGTELDFSKITFAATANDTKKIPHCLRSRMITIELKEYTSEQKKEIACNILQKLVEEKNLYQNGQPLLTITDEALDILINKTSEKGVRQLKMALENNIFRHCLQEWAAAEESQGHLLNKIEITPDLVNQIIPHNFPNIDQENNDQKNQIHDYKEQLKLLHKELKTVQWEKDKLANIAANNNQNKLKASKFHALGVIQRTLNNANFEKDKNILENFDYKKKIENAASPEEIEAIREEILLKIAEKSKKYRQTPTEKAKIIKNYSNDKPIQNNKTLEKLVRELIKVNDNKDNIRSLEEKLSQSEQQTKKIAEKLQTAVLETQKLKKEIQNANKQKNNWNINSRFVLSIVIGTLFTAGGLICWVFYKKRQKKQ